MPISAIVTTKEDTMHLEKVLASLKHCHEIFIVDNGASEKFLELARNKGCTICTHTGTFEDRVNAAIQDAPSNWLLMIDHNETISPELLPYLEEYIENTDHVHGLYIPRKSFILNRWRKSLYPDYQLRFVRKIHTRFVKRKNGKGEFLVTGKTDRIPASMENLALNQLSHSLSGAFDLINTASTKLANDTKLNHISFMRLFFSPLKEFCKQYFITGGIFYGRTGFVFAVNHAIFTYVKLAKIYESRLKTEEGLITID